MIGDVENAMLARIAAASAAGAVTYAYRTLETWPKLFDSYLASKVVQFPACWAAFGGAHKTDRIGTGRWRVHCTFALVVAAENLRNEQARRQGGSPSEPGTYQLAQDAIQLLGNQSLGLDIDAFDPTSILPVESSDIPKLKELSIYAVTFATALYFDGAQPVDDVSDFKIFHADWDPAPYGHVDRDNLPDDPPAVGADNVNLPGPWAP